MKMEDEYKLLEKYKINLAKYGFAKNPEQALRIAKKLGYPVALKIVSETFTHKTDVGGVMLNLEDEEDVLAACRKLQRNVPELDGFLVQKMARKGTELIIGGKKDPQFGHMIILGLGGIYVEVFRDISARLCPVTNKDVHEMVYELKSHPLITGIRGLKPISLSKLSDLMKKVCKLMCKEDIKEMDLNPVIFNEKGYDVVDVRLKK